MQRGFFASICFFANFASAFTQQAPPLFAPPPQQSAVIPLKILSYNVHLLPDVALKVAGNRGDTGYRAGQIGKELALYDIVGLCEVFDSRHSQQLYDAAQTATNNAFHITYGPHRVGVHLIGSGLAILSRYPAEATHTVSYTEASRFLDSGFRADGFAAKGAVHARLRVHDNPVMYVDCFLTHLESRSAAARDVQIEEFTDFVTKYSADNPMIVMGDFNIAANSADGTPEKAQLESLRSKLIQNDQRLLDVWEIAGQGAGNTNEPVASGGNRRIDFIFVSDPTGLQTQLRPVEVEALPFLDEKVNGGSLSDHSAVSCKAELLAPVPSRR